MKKFWKKSKPVEPNPEGEPCDHPLCYGYMGTRFMGVTSNVRKVWRGWCDVRRAANGQATGYRAFMEITGSKVNDRYMVK